MYFGTFRNIFNDSIITFTDVRPHQEQCFDLSKTLNNTRTCVLHITTHIRDVVKGEIYGNFFL